MILQYSIAVLLITAFAKKTPKIKVEVNQTLFLESIKFIIDRQALLGAFSATTFPL